MSKPKATDKKDIGDVGSPDEGEQEIEDPISVIKEIIGNRILEFEDMQSASQEEIDLMVEQTELILRDVS